VLPTESAVRAALRQLDRMTRMDAACLLTATVVALGATAGAHFLPSRLVVAGVVGGIVLGAIYGIALWRVIGARQAMRRSPPHEVTAVGWCRPNDGCNYGIFASDRHLPDVVVALPLRRRVLPSTKAWVFGELTPSLTRSVALVGEEGLLAVGHVLTQERGDGRWQRRETEPGPFVMRPPDWEPPGG
jgi:hypothetical protein